MREKKPTSKQTNNDVKSFVLSGLLRQSNDCRERGATLVRDQSGRTRDTATGALVNKQIQEEKESKRKRKHGAKMPGTARAG